MMGPCSHLYPEECYTFDPTNGKLTYQFTLPDLSLERMLLPERQEVLAVRMDVWGVTPLAFEWWPVSPRRPWGKIIVWVLTVAAGYWALVTAWGKWSRQRAVIVGRSRVA